LQSYKKETVKEEQIRKNPNNRTSIYDIKALPERKGISGWKLTKKSLQASF